jgi:DNA polymerase-4
MENIKRTMARLDQMTISRQEWPRAFALVDMMSFFASVEQRDFPELAGQPVAIVNGESGTTIITASYQARALGISTGTKTKDALKVCPGLVIRPARSERYAEISSNIMAALVNITSDIEIYSVDEAFLELTHVLSLYPSMPALAKKIRQVVYQASGGLACSIGISEGKLTAKFCAKLNKGHTTIIAPSDIKEAIGKAPIEYICGIGRNIKLYLNAQGVHYCKDLWSKPMSILSRRFGNIGKRLYLSCQGYDPEPLAKPQAPKSLGHGKVMPPGTADRELVIATFRHLCEKLAARLRHNELLAESFFIGMKLKTGWIGRKFTTSCATADSNKIWAWAKELIDCWQNEGVYHLQITAIRLRPVALEQLELFSESHCEKQDQIDSIKDKINHKFGNSSLAPANMLKTASKFSVISPAWRPSGVRQSI